MNLQNALDRYTQNKEDAEARAHLHAVAPDFPLFVLHDDGRPDVPLILERYEFFRKTGRVPRGGITLQAWDDRRIESMEACPLTLEPLFKGGDWRHVSPERRLLAAYAAHIGKVPRDGDIDDAIDALGQNILMDRKWIPLQDQWNQILKSDLPEDQMTVIQVKKRLVFKRSESVPHVPVNASAPHVPANTPAPMQQVNNYGFVGQQINAPRNQIQDEIPHVVCLFVDEDKPAIKKLRTHLSLLLSNREITYWDQSMIPSGADIEFHKNQNMERASIVLHMCSPEYVFHFIPNQMVVGPRHIPVMYRHCDVPTYLSQKSSIPNKPVSKYADPDDAWVEVVRGIRAVICYLKNNA